MNTLIAHLSASDFTIVENEWLELILESLADSYSQLFINIKNNDIVDRLSFNDVTKVVLEEESRCKNKEDRKEISKQIEALTMTRGKRTKHGPTGSLNHGKSKSQRRINLK